MDRISYCGITIEVRIVTGGDGIRAPWAVIQAVPGGSSRRARATALIFAGLLEVASEFEKWAVTISPREDCCYMVEIETVNGFNAEAERGLRAMRAVLGTMRNQLEGVLL